MADGPMRILLIDDSEQDAALVIRSLTSAGREVCFERVDNASTMRSSLLRQPWDIVISDWFMPSFSGEAAMEVLKASRVDIPLIIVSGSVGEETAVRAMRSGAQDWVLKDKLARLLPAIERELKVRLARAAAAAGDLAAKRSSEANTAKERTNELERLAELELFHRKIVGRELRMIELKKEIQELKNQLSTKPQ